MVRFQVQETLLVQLRSMYCTQHDDKSTCPCLQRAHHPACARVHMYSAGARVHHLSTCAPRLVFADYSTDSITDAWRHSDLMYTYPNPGRDPDTYEERHSFRLSFPPGYECPSRDSLLMTSTTKEHLLAMAAPSNNLATPEILTPQFFL